MEDINKPQEAFNLWKRLFDENYNPWQSDDWGNTFCVFCYEEYPNHYEDCIYVAAAKLLEYKPVIKVGI